MIIYTYMDEYAPSGIRAFPSLRKAISARADAFDRPDRPEIMQVDIGKLNKAKACALLMGEGYAENIRDIA